MYATYPVYYPSARYARENSEIDLWRESFKINKECKQYLNENAPGAFNDRTLPDFVKNLTAAYGLERAMFVIGRTVLSAIDWDKRYESDVRLRTARFDYNDWKEAQALYEDGKDPYRTADNTTSWISNVHPVKLNAIFRSLMKMEREQINLPSANADRDNELDGEAEI